MSSTIRIASVCQHCRQEFIAKTTVTKYCSDPCAKRAYKARIRDQKVKAAQKVQVQKNDENKERRITPNSYFEVKSLEYLTVKETATMLKCDPRTIYNLAHSGKIKSINLSIRKILILRKDIDALFEVPKDLTPQQHLNTNLNLKRDCLSIGEILRKYNLHETTLASIITQYQIPKYHQGKFVYLPKRAFEPVLRKFILDQKRDSLDQIIPINGQSNAI